MTSEEAIAQLTKLPELAEEARRRAELEVANIIANEARSAAPGSLGSKIFTEQSENATTIIGGNDLSAWVEFGTGNFAKEYVATLPKEWQDEAMKFFISGKGRGHAQPFFFPSVFRHRDDILAQVELELQKLYI